MTQPRILHAPTDVGGQAYGLSRAERELGLESDVVVFASGGLGYGADIEIDLSDASLLTRFRRRLAFLREAAPRYDIFHFNFGQPLMALRAGGRVLNELPLLKGLGKTVLVTFQGCDVRPYESCCGLEDCRAQSRWRGPNARAMTKHADRVFHLNPDLRKWLPRSRFLPYASVDPRAVRALPVRNGEELVVAHAPTNRAIKGTGRVIEAVELLRNEGMPIRLDLIEGVQRDEVLRRVSRADLVVDQLVLGWYGALAVEAMAMARPVLCFILEDEDEDNPFGEDLPIVRTTAETLSADLRVMADANRRDEVGRLSRRFVEECHDPRRVARTVLEGLVELPTRQPLAA